MYGNLEIIIGPMFSGKSTYLNFELTRMADIGKKCLLISHSLDCRNVCKSDNITTHNSCYGRFSSKITFMKTITLTGINIMPYDIIGIDEAQFFEDLYENVIEWVDKWRKMVKIAALCGDFKRQVFGHTFKLIPYCDKIKKLNAYCEICVSENSHMTYENAIFTQKINNGEDIIEIGGIDKYRAVCRYHYNNPTKICDKV